MPKFATRMGLTGLAAAAAIAAMLPSGANAYWVRGYWRPGFVVGVAPPPVVYAPPVAYAPPPFVYAPPPVRHWIPAHYDWRGYFHPGHWA